MKAPRERYEHNIMVRKKMVILGLSMIKNIKGWKISKKLQNANVYVRHFLGATVRCTKVYLKPSLRKNTSFFCSCWYK